MVNLLNLPAPKHTMHGLIEVDVTVARQLIEKYKALTGESLSFTGFLTHCLAQAVQENKAVQSYRKGRKKVVIFDYVHVGLMVEQKVGEKHALTGITIENAGHKDLMEIHQEIRAAQSESTAPKKVMPNWLRLALRLPWPFSSLFNGLLNWYLRNNPTVIAQTGGTVGVTAVGMFGPGHSGWGVASMPYSLSMVVGSTAWKPAVINGQIKPRQILNLTIIFDHDVIDGAPAARFTRRLIELIESGYGLNEIDFFEELGESVTLSEEILEKA